MNAPDDADGDDFPVDAKRKQPTAHLGRAALAPLGSPAEHYHLDAATAEAVLRIERHLADIATALHTIATKR